MEISTLHLWIALSNEQNIELCRTGEVTSNAPQKYSDCLPGEGSQAKARSVSSQSHFKAVRRQLKYSDHGLPKDKHKHLQFPGENTSEAADFSDTRPRAAFDRHTTQSARGR